MYEHIAVVQQYPLGVVHALDVYRIAARLTQLLIYLFGYRLYMAVACACADYEVVGYDRHFANIKHDDIFSFAVLSNLNHPACQFVWFQFYASEFIVTQLYYVCVLVEVFTQELYHKEGGENPKKKQDTLRL